MTINASKSALLVLHYQNGLVKPEGVFAPSGTAAQVEKHKCIEKTAAVIDASRKAGVMVIYVNVAYRPGFPEIKKTAYPLISGNLENGLFIRGSWDAELPDELAPESNDIVIINVNSTAFSHTCLDAILRGNEIKQLFLAGIATNFVVESTTRFGAELGYHITVLEDCCQAFNDEHHNFAIKEILPYYAVIMKSQEYIGNLDKS